jgi:hypothetical protein
MSTSTPRADAASPTSTCKGMPLQDYHKLRSNLRATWLAAPERASPALLNPRGVVRRAAAVTALASLGSPGSATPYSVDFDRDVLHYRNEDGTSSVVLPDCVVPYFAALAGVTAWAVHSRWAPWEAADLFATEFLSRHRLLVGTSKQTVHDILQSACEGSLGRLIELVVVERGRARDSLTSVGLDGPALLAAWHPASFVDVLDPSGRMTTRTGLGDDAPSLFALVPKDVWIRVLEVHCADSVREYVFRDGTLSPDERSVQASLSCFRSAPREQSAATTPLQLCAGDSTCGSIGVGCNAHVLVDEALHSATPFVLIRVFNNHAGHDNVDADRALMILHPLILESGAFLWQSNVVGNRLVKALTLTSETTEAARALRQEHFVNGDVDAPSRVTSSGAVLTSPSRGSGAPYGTRRLPPAGVSELLHGHGAASAMCSLATGEQADRGGA